MKKMINVTKTLQNKKIKAKGKCWKNNITCMSYQKDSGPYKLTFVNRQQPGI